jgi:hypothetical protein
VGTNSAWTFHFSYGSQGWDLMGSSFYALAVHPGDVAAVVPVPAAGWLLGLVGVARRCIQAA